MNTLMAYKVLITFNGGLQEIRTQAAPSSNQAMKDAMKYAFEIALHENLNVTCVKLVD